MVVLGLLVGTGATAVDGWFVKASRELLGADPVWMLLFNQVWVLLPLLIVAVAITLRPGCGLLGNSPLLIKWSDGRVGLAVSHGFAS